MDNFNKKTCNKCKEEVNVKDFCKYISTSVCKECLYEEYLELGMRSLSEKYCFTYAKDLIESMELQGMDSRKFFQNYIRQISSLPQYKTGNYKPKKKRTTLEFLEVEKVKLENNLSKALDKGDVGTYKNLIQAYERVLGLINNEENKPQQAEKSLYFEVNREVTTIYFEDTITVYKNVDYRMIVRDIKKMCKNKDVKIYGDGTCEGLTLLYSLRSNGLNVEDVIVAIYDSNKEPIFRQEYVSNK